MCELSETKRMRALPGLARSAPRNKMLPKVHRLWLVRAQKAVKLALHKMCGCVS